MSDPFKRMVRNAPADRAILMKFFFKLCLALLLWKLCSFENFGVSIALPPILFKAARLFHSQKYEPLQGAEFKMFTLKTGG